MNIRKAAVLFPLVLGGCANGIAGFRPTTYREPAETRVFVSEESCPSLQGAQLAPIIATIALGAASRLLEGFGNALARAGEGGALPASIASSNFEVPRGVTPKCLIIIRGDFAAPRPGARPVTLPSTAFVTQMLGTNQRFVDSTVSLPPVYELHHYVELQILNSVDSSALSFAPVYVNFVRSMDGGTSGQREVSITVKFDRPGKTQTGSVLLIGARQLGRVDWFAPYEPTRRFPYEAAWFSSFHQNTQADATATAGATNLPIPVTVTTTIIETRPTREFLTFIAGVFNGARPTIEGALKSEFDPATREAEDRSALTTQGAYATALAGAHNAVIAYCALGAASTPTDRYTKSAAARTAQLAANSAAMAADVNMPFATSSLIAVDGQAVATANPGRCPA